MSESKTDTKKSVFDSPLLSSKVKSANVKIFPEGVLGYFIGPTLALIVNSVLSAYLNKYMTDVLNLAVWAEAFLRWLPVISVVFVIAGNIIVGNLMNRNKTKAGKARPLLLIAIPLGILALLTLFVFSPFVTDTINTEHQTLALILLAIGYNLWYAVAYPFYYTSHAALVSLSTRNGKHRSLLATISNATSLAAMGLCSMVLPFFLKYFFVYQMDASKLPFGAVPVYDNGVLQYYKTAGENGVAIYDQQASYNAWKIFVIILLVLNIIGIIVEYFFTRERITEESIANGDVQTAKKVPIGQQLKACVKDKYWWIIIVFFLMYQLGGMLKNVSQLYYCTALFADEKGVYTTAFGGTQSGLIAIIGAIPTALGMLIAWPLSNKIGKGKAIMFGSILSVLGGILGLLFPDNFILVVISFVVKALGSTPAMYLSLALLADILDHQEAHHGFRTDGLTMAIYGAIMAGMTGIATGILNSALTSAGYSSATLSNEALRTVLPWLFIGGETIGYGVIAIMFIFMNVEKFSKDDQQLIREHQKAEAEAAGIEWIEPEERLRLEQEEAERLSEEARIAELKARCEKKGLNFEEEEAKYQAKLNSKKKK